MHDQAELVAADAEDHPVVADEIDARSEHGLHVDRPRPVRPADHRVPRPQRCPRLRVLLPEGPERGLRDDLHG